MRDESRTGSVAALLGYIPGTGSLRTAGAGSGSSGGGSGVQLGNPMMSGSSGGVAAAGGDGGGSLEGIHNCIGDKYKQLSDDKGSHLNVRNQNSFNLKKK